MCACDVCMYDYHTAVSIKIYWLHLKACMYVCVRAWCVHVYLPLLISPFHNIIIFTIRYLASPALDTLTASPDLMHVHRPLLKVLRESDQCILRALLEAHPHEHLEQTVRAVGLIASSEG